MYQDCFLSWAAVELVPMGLADFASHQTVLFLADEAVSHSVASFPDSGTRVVQLRALHCLLGWPIHSPSERGISPISAYSSTAFASACVPEILLSPCSHSSGFALQPPTHTCKSRWGGVGFFITGLKAFPWTQATDSKREEGKRLVVRKLSAFPLLLLPAFCADEFLRKTLCVLFLEWMLSLLMAFVE